MIVYVTAEYPFALKKNGAVVFCGGETAAVDAAARDLLEICPLIAAPTRGFFCDEKFMRQSEQSLLKADLRGGAFLRFLAPEGGAPFAVISQQRFSEASVTMYRDGGLKCAIETRGDFVTLPLRGDEAEAREITADGAKFIAVSCGNRLLIFSAGEKIAIAFDAAADEWSCEGSLSTVVKCRDMAKHVISTAYRYSGGVFAAEKTELARDPSFSPSGLPLKLLPFAFAEAALTGDDLEPYLAENLKGKTESLRKYFGAAKGVFPPPDFRKGNNPAILYQLAENVYFCRYLSCEFAGREITNLRLEEE